MRMSLSSASPASREEIGDIFIGKDDVFKGITVEEDQVPNDPVLFEKKLISSLTHWKSKERRGIWIKIPISASQCIPLAVKQGFVFHHAQPTYVMMTLWLPEGENKLPKYTSHYIGCGGVVLNEKNEILLITEKERPELFKIPGGALDAGEEIAQAVEREVWEETGIKAKFESVLGFRHLQNYFFGHPDIYFICSLKLSPESTTINIDPKEIAKCSWKPFEEFVAMATYPTQKTVARLVNEYVKNGYRGFKPVPIAIFNRPGGNSLHYQGTDADFSDLMNPKKLEKSMIITSTN
eukprot:TRINITY_DN4453_c0_g1_i3.p1 TRINITY_DN4453_c0_g1~~TRINITY_DN4453_c0_g1_i3.p1  ORF type:complete len:294 (-),score=58.71 TRINITY_DN4453_c0_g1_i3:224-1105(-)